MASTKQMYSGLNNDVVDWQGMNPHYIEVKTGTNAIKPGMLVRLTSGSGDMEIMPTTDPTNQSIGYALYKETNSRWQKSDVSSAYDKSAWIAVVPIGTDCVVKGFSGTVASIVTTNAYLQGQGTSEGAVALHSLEGTLAHRHPIVGKALSVNTTGAGGILYIKVGV